MSTRLKKETGMTFTETMKKVRIRAYQRTPCVYQLKLNQIADQAGYSDPKYMSRIFREETGMLPSEYRKHICRRERYRGYGENTRKRLKNYSFFKNMSLFFWQ